MGDAYTAVDSGYEAVYYNPAGVAKRNKPEVKFFDVEALASAPALSLVKGSFSKLLDMQGLVNAAAESAGKPYSMGVNLLPQFLVKNFSIGMVARSYVDAFVQPGSGNLDFYSFTDLGVYAHFGVALFGGILKVGVGGKALDRAEVDRTYTPAQYSSGGLTFDHEWKEGIGFGVDAGILLTAPIPGLPALGVAVQDIGDTSFKDRRLLFTGETGKPGPPDIIRQKINVGFSVTGKHGRGNKSVASVEVKDIVNLKGVTNFHAGGEVGLSRAVYIRVGVNQGRYPTGGLGFHVGPNGVEFSTYGEDINLGSGRPRRDDRKYVGRYVLSF